MGNMLIGTSSNHHNDKYVLRVDRHHEHHIHPQSEDDDQAATTTTNSNLLSKVHPGKVHPSTPTLSTASLVTLHSKPNMLKQQSSLSSKPNAHMAKQLSTVSLSKQPQIIRAPSQLKGEMMKMPSQLLGGKTDKRLVCSDSAPWLIKNTQFQGKTLSDFEYGRVIG
jgi:hypothetical protein